MEDLTYYGRMDDPLIGDQTLGVLCMDLAFRKVLDKNKILFEEQREETIKALREVFKVDFRNINRAINELKKKVEALEERK